MLLTGARIWPAEGTGPWADLLVVATAGDDPLPVLLHVAAGPARSTR